MTKAKISAAPLNVVDTGWAWAVAAAACFCLFFTCGFAYSTGVYYLIFLETFGAGKGMTAWISSLNFGMLCAIGPISSKIINNISCRCSVFIGGILSSIGLVISAFATDIYTLFATFGIITGAGFGLVFTPCVVVISEYFVKYRVIAMGLSISGTGLGTIFYPWLSRHLIATYGWRGALILSGAINAHVCIAALIMRPNRDTRRLTVRKAHAKKNKHGRLIMTEKTETITTSTPPYSMRSMEKSSSSSIESKNHYNTVQTAIYKDQKQEQLNQQHQPESSTININMSRTAVNYTSRRARVKFTLKRIAQDFGLDIFTKSTFILISINTFLFCFGMSVMYTHISAYAALVGLSVQARDSLLSSIGFTNVIGRLALALAAHFLPIDATYLFIAAYFFAGLGVVMCAFWTSFHGLLICVCTFGFFSAGFGPLLSEVTCLAVGVMKFSMAYGYLMVFMAAGTIVGAPIAGSLYDMTHLYESSFYLGGVCLCLASLTMLLDILPSMYRGCSYRKAAPEEPQMQSIDSKEKV